MNIGELAKITAVSTDTLRYYEKEGLLNAPIRKENGYRAYSQAHISRIQFIRGAQTLGFSLAEIREVLPRLDAGQFGRAEIEHRLNTKIAQIDEHMRQLRKLKKELTDVFSSLTCSAEKPISMLQVTAEKTNKPVQKRRLAKAVRRNN